MNSSRGVDEKNWTQYRHGKTERNQMNAQRDGRRRRTQHVACKSIGFPEGAIPIERWTAPAGSRGAPGRRNFAPHAHRPFPVFEFALGKRRGLRQVRVEWLLVGKWPENRETHERYRPQVREPCTLGTDWISPGGLEHPDNIAPAAKALAAAVSFKTIRPLIARPLPLRTTGLLPRRPEEIYCFPT